MTLDYLNINTCLTFTLVTFTSVFATNTIKNNVANTINSELEKKKCIVGNDYETIIREIRIITKCELFTKVLLGTAVMQSLITLGGFLYFKTEIISNSFLICSEKILLTLFLLGIVACFIVVILAITMPKQNLLFSKWDIPE